MWKIQILTAKNQCFFELAPPRQDSMFKLKQGIAGDLIV